MEKGIKAIGNAIGRYQETVCRLKILPKLAVTLATSGALFIAATAAAELADNFLSRYKAPMVAALFLGVSCYVEAPKLQRAAANSKVLLRKLFNEDLTGEAAPVPMAASAATPPSNSVPAPQTTIKELAEEFAAEVSESDEDEFDDELLDIDE